MKGRPRSHPSVRLDHAHRVLGTRHAIALHARRHPNLVPRHCAPVACDKDSRQLLYDFEEALDALSRVSSRRVA